MQVKFICLFKKFVLILIEFKNNIIMVIDDMFYSEDDLKNIFKLQEYIYKDSREYLTIQECINVWQRYSWSVCASWLFFDDNYEVNIRMIKSDIEFNNFKEYSNI